MDAESPFVVHARICRFSLAASHGGRYENWRVSSKCALLARLPTNKGNCVYADPAWERRDGIESVQVSQADSDGFRKDMDRVVATDSWQDLSVCRDHSS
jgi:hypothetical protein